MPTPKYNDGMGVLYKTRNRYGEHYEFGIILKPLILKIGIDFKHEVFYEVYTKGIIVTIPETMIQSSFEQPY